MIPVKNLPNASSPSASEPFGNIKDNDGTGNGVAVDKETFNDIFQFFAKMAFEGGVTPNNQLDNAYYGFQLWEALSALLGGLKTKILSMGVWNMDSTTSIAVNHGLGSILRIMEVTAFVYADGGSPATALNSVSVGGALGGGINWDSSQVTVYRTTGGVFDTTGYDDGAMNRGYIVIRYTS